MPVWPKSSRGRPKTPECPSCRQKFTSQREADDHQKQMHAGTKGGEREGERRDVPREE